jgi:hypothetical protein
MPFGRKDRGVYLQTGSTHPEYVPGPRRCLVQPTRGFIIPGWMGYEIIKNRTWEQKKANEI